MIVTKFKFPINYSHTISDLIGGLHAVFAKRGKHIILTLSILWLTGYEAKMNSLFSPKLSAISVSVAMTVSKSKLLTLE